ncbi:MAG: KamA family radical SAM protein [Proteobacteria bacterium]|nr:KamA family radical SAM protein [Pseudomonadota bacterium]
MDASIREWLSRPEDFAARFGMDARGVARATAGHPALVNPYFLSLIRSADDPLGRQVVPDPREADDPSGPDPLAEESMSPAPGLVHRYPDRVLLLAETRCAVRCRYCMRKRLAGESAPDPGPALAYIRDNPGVREVILSGGDPLMMETGRLEDLLARLKAIPHVEVLRIHSRVPGALPERISPDLAAMLARFHPLYVNIQFNHPAELTPQAGRACGLLAETGIPLGSQTVLLAGVNDRAETLAALFRGLLALRVRPYYLHHLDRVPGTAHFQVPLSRGLRILEDLRGRLPGIAVPQYMVDLPGGGGKVPVTPRYILGRQGGAWLIRDVDGRVVRVPEDG